MILTYKYRLKGKRSARHLRRKAWAANQVWNYCVATQRAVQRAWNAGLSPRWPSQYDLQRLTGGRPAIFTSMPRRSRVSANSSRRVVISTRVLSSLLKEAGLPMGVNRISTEFSP